MNRMVGHADALQIIGSDDNYVIKFQTLVPEIIDEDTVKNVIAQDMSVFINKASLVELSKLIDQCLNKKE